MSNVALAVAKLLVSYLVGWIGT